MAKIYSSFGSSPQDSIFGEYWNFHHLPNESYDASILIKNEPELPELFEDLHLPYSITKDILRLSEENGGLGGNGSSESDAAEFISINNCFDNESKVRNKNLMWSGTTAPLSTSASSSVSDNGGALVPLSFVTGCFSTSPIEEKQQLKQEQQQQQHLNNSKPPPTVVIANNNKSRSNANKQNQQQQQHFSLFASIKAEPFDDYEQQLQQHNILNNKTSSASSASCTKEQENMQNIPPGTSLLRKSNIQQQNNRKQQSKHQTSSSISIPKMYTSEFVRERDQLLTTTTLNAPVNKANGNVNGNGNSKNNAASIGVYGRPDTPHSLDDETTAFLYSNENEDDNDNNDDNEDDVNDDNDNDNDCSNLTGFRHQVDLRACIMGSNNISLTATDPTPLINHLSQQLQDTSKDQIDMPFIVGSNNSRSLAEVLDYINNKDIDDVDDVDDVNDCCGDMVDGDALRGSSSSCRAATEKMTTSMRNLHTTSGYDSDEESLNDACSISSSLMNEDSLCAKVDECISSSSGSNSNSNSPANSPISHSSSSNINSNRNGSSSAQYNHVYARSSNGQQQQKHQPAQQQQQQSYLHSDHSYTRCKDGIDDLGNLDHLDTPSDSDEEIDVVSIGDKKLPTNPSDRDRRALQTKVACKFANPRNVKTVNGVRTIPAARSRGSFELPYTPVSSSPVKSVVNSRYPSPASTPYHNQYTTTSTPMIIVNGNCEKSRKRININGGNGGINSGFNSDSAANTIEYPLPPFKKCRGKKQQTVGSSSSSITISTSTSNASNISSNNNSNNSNSSASTLKRHYSSDETNDTIEKRNLHNDMERQRRIGLKNLFDMLKKQIPSIKDKERAPKVNILREAAKLCETLTREEEQLNEQKAMLKEQLRTRKELVECLRNIKNE